MTPTSKITSSAIPLSSSSRTAMTVFETPVATWLINDTRNSTQSLWTENDLAPSLLATPLFNMNQFLKTWSFNDTHNLTSNRSSWTEYQSGINSATASVSIEQSNSSFWSYSTPTMTRGSPFFSKASTKRLSMISIVLSLLLLLKNY